MKGDSGSGGQRLAGLVLVVASGVAGVVLAWLVVLPRFVRRHRDMLLGRGLFRQLVDKYNDTTRSTSGTERSSSGLLTHVGRCSGRVYHTPLGAHAYHDGFLLPLGYGTNTDWYRNLMAAGSGELAWKGRTFRLERPEVVSGADATYVWPTRDRVLLWLAGMHEFVWLHACDDQPVRSLRSESSIEEFGDDMVPHRDSASRGALAERSAG
ncbi:nitroreductase/quinone reductase family protein [Nocardia jiangxiensis]|uniref:Nitroreductase/quinone reductase family protein n=1 Tax=Nocardia jiangxiensis TaxID=282685 RepID=A0ABW6S975_9NOCA|nr:nitroreductase/quinone reductase family protein [Nocardia jiangxiensis]